MPSRSDSYQGQSYKMCVLSGKLLAFLFFSSCLHLWAIGAPLGHQLLGPILIQNVTPAPQLSCSMLAQSLGALLEGALLPGMFLLPESWLYSHGLPSIFALPSGAPQTLAFLWLLLSASCTYALWHRVCHHKALMAEHEDTRQSPDL